MQILKDRIKSIKRQQDNLIITFLNRNDEPCKIKVDFAVFAEGDIIFSETDMTILEGNPVEPHEPLWILDEKFRGSNGSSS
ncbi:MAG: hypothetical protein ACTSRF_09945 [Candidatus Freyarchaeota archaeon]